MPEGIPSRWPGTGSPESLYNPVAIWPSQTNQSLFYYQKFFPKHLLASIPTAIVIFWSLPILSVLIALLVSLVAGLVFLIALGRSHQRGGAEDQRQDGKME